MTMPAVFSPEGRIDGTNAPDAEAQMLPLLDGDVPGLVVDMTKLEYISSAGLRILLVVAKAAKQKGRKIVLAAPTPTIEKVLQLSGFDRLMPLKPTLDDAIAACR